MENICILSLIENYDAKLRRVIKDVYNLKNDVRVFNWDDIKISNKDFNIILDLANKKINDEDITFDLGYKYFRNNKLKITKGVFVPQFDTEQIVDLVLNKGIINGKAIEIGSGSGAISISLSKETNLEITSLDINPKAIKLSKENDIQNKVNFLKCDFKKFKSDKKYNLIISNPPYIEKGDKEIEPWVLENQPSDALFADEKGLSMYKLIFNKGKDLLLKGGYIIVEIGYNQASDVKKLANAISNNIEVVKDYSGYDRFVIVKYE